MSYFAPVIKTKCRQVGKNLKSVEAYSDYPQPGVEGADVGITGVVVELNGGVQPDGGEGEGEQVKQQVHRFLRRPRAQDDPVRHDRCTSFVDRYAS